MKATSSNNEPTMQSMSIGEKMRRLREAKDLNQQNVADEMDMSLSGYAKMERGEVNPSWKNIEKFAEIIGVKSWQVGAYGEEGVHISGQTNNQIAYILSGSTVNNYPENTSLWQERIRHLETELASAQREIAHLSEIVALLRKA